MTQLLYFLLGYAIGKIGLALLTGGDVEYAAHFAFDMLFATGVYMLARRYLPEWFGAVQK